MWSNGYVCKCSSTGVVGLLFGGLFFSLNALCISAQSFSNAFNYLKLDTDLEFSLGLQ